MNSIQPIKTTQYEQLPVAIYQSNEAMGQAAALDARDIINKYLDKTGRLIADLKVCTVRKHVVRENVCLHHIPGFKLHGCESELRFRAGTIRIKGDQVRH